MELSASINLSPDTRQTCCLPAVTRDQSRETVAGRVWIGHCNTFVESARTPEANTAYMLVQSRCVLFLYLVRVVVEVLMRCDQIHRPNVLQQQFVGFPTIKLVT